jgi:hypothetical protein
MQYPQKINFWAGIFNNQIITVGNLNSQTYLDILINEVGPQLKKLHMKIKRFWCNVQAISKSLDWPWWYHKLAGQISESCTM